MSEPEKKCAGCGSCTVVCPVYRATGNETLTARGKQRLLGSDLSSAPSEVFKDIFAKCLLCGACESVCPRNLPIVESVVQARSRFSGHYGRHGLRKTWVDKTLHHPLLLAGLAQVGSALEKTSLLPPWSGLRRKLAVFHDPAHYRVCQDDVPSDSTSQFGEMLLFSGCFARYVQPSILSSVKELLLHQDGKEASLPVGQKCCGQAAYSMGGLEEARSLARDNIAAFETSDLPIIVPCASCYSHLNNYPQLLIQDQKWHARALSFSNRLRTVEDSFLRLAESGLLRGPPQGVNLVHHSSCHQRFSGYFSTSPGQVYSLVQATNYLGETKHCCGFGGLFQIGYPEISETIFQGGYEKLHEKNPTLVITSCSGCLIWWNQELLRLGSTISCQHPAQFLASCLSHKDKRGQGGK